MRLESSLSLIATKYWRSYMQVLVSRDEKTRVTAILVHGLSKSEQTFIENAMCRREFWYLTIHPMFTFGLIAEVLRVPIWGTLLHNSEEAVKPVLEFGKRDGSGKTGLEAKNTNVEDDAEQALYRQHMNVQVMENIEWASRAVQKLKSCCKDINNTGTNQVASEALMTAGQIILKRLEDMEVRLEGDRIHAQTTQALTQAHRQSLEIQNATINNKLNLLISSQSRDIARESKRDSSAMKAIALLTMLFLPGTFVAAFFAMPLFNWEASASSDVLLSRFWIYWAVTVPATVIVLVLWRMWFKFDHWRMTRGESSSFWKDARTWLKSGRPEAEEDDVEKGSKEKV
ncbi:hypothetical protein L207DRAFT_538850 [Hyaloscypha variabilis F]|uniref:Cora-domain-containing protein n=1 Tax=Hyaloscypha variabilis (strain UAMH 11265 / GT02V1 / F) TaxID=1149755 RepID=A0A2J6QT36_HYAVF|nr:hypothetical protein L207DRAFT_538850 [Hyaloscypha variabilis F]